MTNGYVGVVGIVNQQGWGVRSADRFYRLSSEQIYAMVHTCVQHPKLQSRQSCRASKPFAQVSCLRNTVKGDFAKTREGSFTNDRANVRNDLAGLQRDRSAHRFSK